MENREKVWEIPYGTRDFLPREAAEKRAIETAIAEQFNIWGYDEIVTPTVELLDNLTAVSGSNLEPHMFKLFDKNNRTLALRYEMTTPIARVAASRMKDDKLPLKLSYISSVFRYEQTQTGRQCEFHQAGVELLGSDKPTADAEVIALAASVLRKAGLGEFIICLGQVDFINGLMKECGIQTKDKNKIRAAIEKRDLVGLNRIVDEADISDEAKEKVKEIPLLHGGRDVLKKAYSMINNEQSRRALDNLSEIHDLLEAYGVAEYITFDLGVIRDFSYYTGMVFEVYTPGLGYPLCGGGRYDNMLTDFGREMSATGFALGIERIMLALERHGLKQEKKQRDVYVAFGAAKAAEAIKAAQKLRQAGEACELSFGPSTEQEAEAYREEKGYQQLIFIK